MFKNNNNLLFFQSPCIGWAQQGYPSVGLPLHFLNDYSYLAAGGSKMVSSHVWGLDAVCQLDFSLHLAPHHLGVQGRLTEQAGTFQEPEQEAARFLLASFHVYCVLSAKLNKAQIQVVGKLDHTPPDGRSYEVTGSKGPGLREMGRICNLVSSTRKLKELLHETGCWHL